MTPLKSAARRIVFVVVLLTMAPLAHAQLEFSASPTPVGSGARAAGMADAFLAIADDATAASWNPAGLVQLQRPEMSVVGAYNGISEEFRSRDLPDLNGDHYSDQLELNFLSVVVPIPIAFGTRNVSLSLTYQHKYDFSRMFDVGFGSSSDIAGTPVTSFTNADFEQTGGFSTISPSIAVELTEKLSVGVSFNIWTSSFLSDNDWEKKITSTATTTIGTDPPRVTNQVQYEKYSDFDAVNYGIGVLWRATPKFALGLRYDTAFSGDADFRGTISRNGQELGRVEEERTIHIPDTISFGASFRVNDRWTMALDVSRTDWNGLYLTTGDGTRLSLIDGTNIDDPTATTDFDSTTTVRFGTEYVFIPRTTGTELNRLWTLRGGLFFDQEPASGASVAAGRPVGDGHPDNFYGFAVGGGLLAFQRFNFDIAYQLRYGNNVNSDLISGVENFSEDVIQHRLLLSTVIYF